MVRTAFALGLLAAGASAFQVPLVPRQSLARSGVDLRSSDFVVSTGNVMVSEPAAVQRGPTMDGKSNAIRGRIGSVKNTKKITEAMRLVAAAKVRRAQEAVISTRPFNEGLQSVFSGLVKRLAIENIELPLLQDRPVKTVTLVVLTGDRGLCGGYNSKMLKLAERRIGELKGQGLEVELITIGNKGTQYFRSRAKLRRSFEMGQAPNPATASAIAEELLSEYLSGEVDRVEFLYTRFVNLITSEPSIRTILPLKAQGVENQADEIFSVTTEEGQIVGEKTTLPPADAEDLFGDVIFEQDPIQILNAILPLYINGQVLRMLQESVASELGARMQAMQSASDNAEDLAERLTITYNRARQSAITNEICEIVAGANSVDDSGAQGGKDALAFEYETGDEFEAERIRDFAEWYATLDDFKENLLQDA